MSLIETTHGLLSARDRAALRPDQFGLPEERAYPIHDAEHARLAIELSAAAYAHGHLTRPQHDQIVSRARAALARFNGPRPR